MCGVAFPVALRPPEQDPRAGEGQHGEILFDGEQVSDEFVGPGGGEGVGVVLSLLLLHGLFIGDGPPGGLAGPERRPPDERNGDAFAPLVGGDLVRQVLRERQGSSLLGGEEEMVRPGGEGAEGVTAGEGRQRHFVFPLFFGEVDHPAEGAAAAAEIVVVFVPAMVVFDPAAAGAGPLKPRAPPPR